MQCLHIHGGTRLVGEVTIHGAKNAALPLLVATLLTDKPLVFDDMPQLTDVESMMQILQELGTEIEKKDRSVTLQTRHVTTPRAPYESVRKMRASFMVLGGLLARLGHAEVSLPGGCAIGVRPVDFHLDGLRALGASIEIDKGYIIAKAPGGRLPGGRYVFPKVSVTGTQNLIFAAVTAKGESCLVNVAQEPETTDLVTCLQNMGAKIEGKGTSTLTIQGVDALNGHRHRILPDRIEMGTFMVAAAITRGDLVLRNCDLSLLPDVVPLLESTGVQIIPQDDISVVRVRCEQRPEAFAFVTHPYPGFPTDLQAQFMALASVAHGVSSITETIWENRFMHVNELARMGAKITMEGHQALVYGQETLVGARVMATDLRASVGLVLAGLAADGATDVLRIYHLDRGYERIEDRLNACGARIARMPYDPEDA